MGREMRWRTAGILFYIVALSSLLLTKAGEEFIRNLFNNLDQLDVYQLVVGLIGVGVGVFTSDAVGYVISTVVFFWWEILLGKFRSGEGGYSSEYQKRAAYNIKDIIIERYGQTKMKISKAPQHEKFELQWKTYSADVFLSYIWQYAPSYIDNWDTRRYTIFFTNLSTATGILLGFITSIILIFIWNMGWTLSNYLIAVIVLSITIMLIWNADAARKEGWQMVDLWVAGIINPRLKKVLDDLKSNIDVEEE
jgi:hypothetical protein